MNRFSTVIFCVVFFLAPLCGAFASPILAVNNPTVQNPFCDTYSSNLCGQSFVQGQSNISGAGVYLIEASPGAITLSIYSSYSTAPSGLIASGSANVSSAGWIDVFWTPENIASAATYFLVLDSGTQSMQAAFSSGSYPDGNAIYRGSATAFPGYDLTFRTYYENGAQIPLPASLPLLAAGIGLMGYFGRRKKAALS